MRILLGELLAWAPAIGYFAWLALCPDMLGPLDGPWVFGIAFLFFDPLASLMVAGAGSALLTPGGPRLHERGQPLSSTQIDVVLVGCALFVLVVIPAHTLWLTGQWGFASDIVAIFAPRVMLVTRMRRRATHDVRTEVRCALLPALLLAAIIVLILLLGCSGKLNSVAACCSVYYLVCAVGCALVRVNAQMATRPSWHWL